MRDTFIDEYIEKAKEIGFDVSNLDQEDPRLGLRFLNTQEYRAEKSNNTYIEIRVGSTPTNLWQYACCIMMPTWGSSWGLGVFSSDPYLSKKDAVYEGLKYLNRYKQLQAEPRGKFLLEKLTELVKCVFEKSSVQLSLF